MPIRAVDINHPDRSLDAAYGQMSSSPSPTRLAGATDSEVVNMLRDFAIRPHTIWPKNRTPTSKSSKGYRRSQFEAAWRSYCAEDGTPAHASNIRALRLADAAQRDGWD